MFGGFKIPPRKIDFSNKAAVHCSRRLRGLSPLPISPLAAETRRGRANSLSTLQIEAQPLLRSPSRSRSVSRQSRNSVIVHSNPDSAASSPRSGEWDSYSEQPTFWNSRFGWINQPNQIQLVPTESESSVEVEADLINELRQITEDSDPSNRMAADELSNQISALKKVHGAIKAELLLFTPDDLTEAAASLLPPHLDSVKKLFVSLSTGVDELEENFPTEVAVIQEWKIKLNNTRDSISTNQKQLMEKNQSFVRASLPPPTAANLSTASLESQMSILRINEE